MANARSSTAWAGWLIFAAVVLGITGAINVFEGLFGLIYRYRTVLVAAQLYVVNVTSWALVLIVSGAIMIAAGIGLASRRTWARVTAIVVVGVHAIIQVAWMGAYPVWSLLMLALDIVVLFALTARWDSAAEPMSDLTGVSPAWDRNTEPRPPH
ncbi:MAG TPA: hypothetical protein VF892_13265 [Pseudonocardiaceae bacterium]